MTLLPPLSICMLPERPPDQRAVQAKWRLRLKGRGPPLSDLILPPGPYPTYRRIWILSKARRGAHPKLQTWIYSESSSELYWAYDLQAEEMHSAKKQMGKSDDPWSRLNSLFRNKNCFSLDLKSNSWFHMEKKSECLYRRVVTLKAGRGYGPLTLRLCFLLCLDRQTYLPFCLPAAHKYLLANGHVPFLAVGLLNVRQGIYIPYYMF